MKTQRQMLASYLDLQHFVARGLLYRWPDAALAVRISFAVLRIAEGSARAGLSGEHFVALLEGSPS
jgi:hypothetical protein